MWENQLQLTGQYFFFFIDIMNELNFFFFLLECKVVLSDSIFKHAF